MNLKINIVDEVMSPEKEMGPITFLLQEYSMVYFNYFNSFSNFEFNFSLNWKTDSLLHEFRHQLSPLLDI